MLRCPHCGQALVALLDDAALGCPLGHRFDVAREGYVALLSGPVGRDAGDDAAMIAARVAIEQAGHFAPLDAALTALLAAGSPRLVLDVGAGTGSLLAACLDALDGARGVALDVSRAACRRAARAHPSLAAVRADVWSQVPLQDGTVDVALDVFAPRNGAELARVLVPGGTLVVVTPGEDHLAELRQFHTLTVHPGKDAQLQRHLGGWFEELAPQSVRWTMTLTAAEAVDVLRMGPSARHLRPGALKRLSSRTAAIAVTGAVDVRPLRLRA
jgi:SAM-dependent methyltransferase